MRRTALIVEQNPDTRQALDATLASADIDSIHAASPAAIWPQLRRAPDILILDIDTPDCDGPALLRQLRQTTDIPVLIHSTFSDDIESIIDSENGLADFLPKPCNMRELLARVRSLLRRAQQAAPSARPEQRRLRFGNWTLDMASRQLTRAGSPPTTLGVSGYALLQAFLDRPFETLSREHLSRVLNREYMPYDRIIDVHVSQIRRILGKQPDGSSFIKTLRSLGYIFVANVETGD